MENAEQQSSQLWHSIEGEPAHLFDYFKKYLLMPKPRSAKVVAEQCGKTAGYFEKLATKWNWVKRAEAYDDWVRETELQKHEEAVELSAENESKLWSKRRLEIRDEEYSMGKRMLGLGKKHLDRYEALLSMPTVETKTTRKRYSEDGKEVIEEITIKPLVHRTGDPIKAIDTGLTMMRRASEMETETIKHTFGGIATAQEDFVTLTEEERIKRKTELAREEADLLDKLKARGEEME